MKFIINGKFLSQNITGVQRYAREILTELDKIIDDKFEIEMAVPPNVNDIPHYKNIEAKIIGKFNSGVLWEQISLAKYVLKNKAICINLCTAMPILANNITALHDVSFKVNPEFYSKKMRYWTNFVWFLCINRIKKVITVSEFSKSEILKYYNISENKIDVIYNGWQHFKDIKCDKETLKKYELNKGEYYFSMSSLTKNKNFKWVAENAYKNPNIIYAVSGSINNRVFSKAFDFDVPKNMKFLGYVSDEEAKTLMQNCKAFLFPTFYEGFGIPPLEAISTGAKAVVSDASCMREIYGNTVYYIDPYNPDVDLDNLLKGQVSDSAEILKKYSWNASAERLYELLYEFSLLSEK